MSELGDIQAASVNSVRNVIPFPSSVHEARGNQPAGAAAPVVDSVELSPEATALADEFAGSNIRFEKVARIRSELQSGVYDINGKIDAVIDRIIEDLLAQE